MHQHEPVDIVRDVVRGENNRNNGGSFSVADCAVQGVLSANFSWAGI